MPTKPTDEICAQSGIGLRPPHHRAFVDGSPAVGWLEVHSENFFCEGGEALRLLDSVRARYPISLHGVGLSLGSPAGAAGYAAADAHLEALARLVARTEPVLVSEHLCWSAVDGTHFNDLLPLPYTEEALAVVCDRIDQAQQRLRRRILIENVSAYVRFAHQTISEPEFVAAVAQRTGCGILLDVNNVYVSACNFGFDARAYIDAMPAVAVEEIHLAGHDLCADGTDHFLIDTHGRAVQDAVWKLYDYTLARLGPRPTLVEWDTDIPPLAVLQNEANQAQARLSAAAEKGSVDARAAA